MTVSDTPGRSTWKCVYDQGPQRRGTGHIEPRGNRQSYPGCGFSDSQDKDTD